MKIPVTLSDIFTQKASEAKIRRGEVISVDGDTAYVRTVGSNRGFPIRVGGNVRVGDMVDIQNIKGNRTIMGPASSSSPADITIVSGGSGGGAVYWDGIISKPEGYSPSLHAVTHHAGNADELTPHAIGAVQLSGDTVTGNLIIQGDLTAEQRLRVGAFGSEYIEVDPSTEAMEFYTNGVQRTQIQFDGTILDSFTHKIDVAEEYGASSYDESGGSGDRRALITVSSTVSNNVPFMALDIQRLVDGEASGSVVCYFNGAISTKHIRFDFGNAKYIIEAKATFNQSSNGLTGVWQWQGSNNASTWTNIGSNFTPPATSYITDGARTGHTQMYTELAGNTTAYRYYQMLGVSGDAGGSIFGPMANEFCFKIAPLISVGLSIGFPSDEGNFTVTGAGDVDVKGSTTLEGALNVTTTALITHLNADQVDSHHASATPAAATIPISDGSSKLDGWVTPNPVGANPTVTAGKAVNNGSAATWMRSDATPIIGDSDKVDGFHASATAAIDTIPVSDHTTGKIAAGFVPDPDLSSVVPYTGASGDVTLGVHKVTASTLESTVAIGTAPLVVASTTLVANLNADTLDGLHASEIAAGSLGDGTVTNAKLANMAASTLKGNSTAGSAVPADLSVADVITLLGLGSSTPVTLAVSADVLLGLTGQELSLDVQNANKVLVGPTTGADAAPTFRALVAGDLPATAVTPASYGDTTHTPVITIDAAGRITNATVATIAGGTGSSAAITTFTVDGSLYNVGAAPFRFYNIYGSSRTISKVMISVGIAPTGQAILVDIHKDGTTIFTTQAHRPTIAISGFSGSTTSIDVATWADGSYLEVQVDQCGTVSAGSFMTVQILHS